MPAGCSSKAVAHTHMSDERIAKESEISLHISCKLQNQRKHNTNFSFFRLDGKILQSP